MPQTNLTKAKARAKALGVEVKPSTRKHTKSSMYFLLVARKKWLALGTLDIATIYNTVMRRDAGGTKHVTNRTDIRREHPAITPIKFYGKFLNVDMDN
eukprot:1806019-Prymnesium_polylepis.1